MKRNLVLLVLVTSGLFIACKSDKADEKASTLNENNTNADINSGSKDTVPSVSYPAYNSNKESVTTIVKALSETILKSDLTSIPADQRKFKYHAIDLNGDQSDEYFVTPIGNYFCGTGGCSAFIIDQKGNLVSSFSVTDFPVHIAESSTNGWKDLIILSNGKNHLIKMKNGKYPSNPSVEPEFNGEIPKTSGAILDIYNSQYPAFDF